MVNEVKIFRCGLCNRKEQYAGTRKGLREHIRNQHRILTAITNSSYIKDKGYIKQDWWIVENFNGR